MEQSFLRKFGFLIVMAVLGGAAVALLYDGVSPKASLNLRHSQSEIKERARAYLLRLGYDLKDYQQDAALWFDGNSQLFLQSRFGMKKANEMLRADSLATHNWYVTWYDRTVPQSQSNETFGVAVSPAGRILGFDHTIKDSIPKGAITEADARTLAERFLAAQGIDLSRYFLKTSSESRLSNRVDRKFEYASRDTAWERTIWVRVQGDEVGGFRENFAPQLDFQRMMSQIGTSWTFFFTASLAGAFLLFFYIVILFLKKYHEGEVGTRTALLVFIGLFAVSVLSILNRYTVLGVSVQMGDLNKFNVRIVMLVFNVFIIQLFLGVMVFAAWSVGESSSRTTWPAKLRAIDSALFRKFFSLDVGESVLRGYCWGLILLGAYTVLLYLLIEYSGAGLFVQSTDGLPESYFPSLFPVLTAIVGAVFAEIVFRLFFISFVKEKTKKVWLGVLVSTVIWTATTLAVWEMPYGFLRLQYSFLVLFAFGFIFSVLFLKYDVLTSITANFVILGLAASVPLFSSTGPSYHTASLVSLVIFSLPVLIAIGGLVRRQRFQFSPDTLPEHVRRISERERMAKELEIARKVQLSLLPKVNPIARGYDIAGICLPAMEVGGDYYDFVNLGSKKIGIAIGDVSGKGVPAAIYMTLTKGILQSHAEDNISPKHVLSKVNSLMYRTIDRNSFVSMFYAILDLENKTIRFSRAGQCPVIIAQRDGEKGSFLTPKGMALGLEMGKVFDSVLEERELELQSGEVLVFYTDGFTEAMNAHGEEFGESRLVEAIARHRQRNAAGIIQSICDEVQTFIADASQHDDMTMVVVKVG